MFTPTLKTYDNYTHLAQLTLFIFFLQVLSAVAVFVGGHLLKLKPDGLVVFLPALLVTAYISWVALDGLGVSWRAAWADWNDHAGKDLLKALVYFCGYVLLIAAMVGLALAVYYFIGDGFGEVLKKTCGHRAGEIEQAVLRPVSCLLLLFTACVVTPVAEELFFRRIMYTTIRLKNGFWVSALSSGLLFAVFHGRHALVIFPVGIYLCWVYERERRLPVNIMLHGLVNFSVTLFKTFA